MIATVLSFSNWDEMKTRVRILTAAAVFTLATKQLLRSAVKNVVWSALHQLLWQAQKLSTTLEILACWFQYWQMMSILNISSLMRRKKISFSIFILQPLLPFFCQDTINQPVKQVTQPAEILSLITHSMEQGRWEQRKWEQKSWMKK